jgi:hypothetical protein
VGLLLGLCAGLMPERALILLTSAACTGCFGPRGREPGSATGVAMWAISVAQSLTAAHYGGASQPV